MSCSACHFRRFVCARVWYSWLRAEAISKSLFIDFLQCDFQSVILPIKFYGRGIPRQCWKLILRNTFLLGPVEQLGPEFLIFLMRSFEQVLSRLLRFGIFCELDYFGQLIIRQFTEFKQVAGLSALDRVLHGLQKCRLRRRCHLLVELRAVAGVETVELTTARAAVFFNCRRALDIDDLASNRDFFVAVTAW